MRKNILATVRQVAAGELEVAQQRLGAAQGEFTQAEQEELLCTKALAVTQQRLATLRTKRQQDAVRGDSISKRSCA